MSDDNFQEVLDEVQSFLEKLIDENKDTLNKEDCYEVRPSIAYGEFRLGWIEGSYNKSLQGLIHHYMFEKKLYEKLLTDEQLKNCAKIVKESPEYIYQPDESEQGDILDDIYWECISLVGKKLTSMGHELDSTFEEYLED